MKNLSAVAICVLTVLAMAVQQSFAQDNAPTFGVKVGLNLANFSWDLTEGTFETDSAIKFGVGGIMLYPLSEVLDLQVELMYLQKGAKLDEIEGFKIDAKYKFAYLSVPVMGRYKLGSGDTSPYIAAGPEFGFLLSADVEFAGEEDDVKDEIKSIEIGFNVGAGVSMDMGTMPAFAEVRYSLGLSNIDDSTSDVSIKTTGIQLFVGVMF